MGDSPFEAAARFAAKSRYAVENLFALKRPSTRISEVSLSTGGPLTHPETALRVFLRGFAPSREPFQKELLHVFL